jgi:hypothetical protein
MNGIMDSARDLIVSRIKEFGLTMSDLSLQVGKNHAYFQQFIKRGIPARLPEEVRGRVAQILKVDERDLKVAGPKNPTPASAPNARIGGGVRIATWIPVYGHAVGGKDGEFILNGNQVTEVLAPASLSTVADAYAVYVVGDSMEPRYFAGETVFINPRLPVSRGTSWWRRSRAAMTTCRMPMSSGSSRRTPSDCAWNSSIQENYWISLLPRSSRFTASSSAATDSSGATQGPGGRGRSPEAMMTLDPLS